MKTNIELVNKSIAASLLIALGDFALLKLGTPIGPVIFALGLLGVCYMNLNLFTGKCGFVFSDKIKWEDLLTILIVNLVAGYMMGLVFSITDYDVYKNAIAKVATWDVSIAFFVRSILCGVIMYVAVLLYKKGTPLGILYGIPLFIFCGFQHCIANIITLGAARTFHLSIYVCVLGNLIGSLLIWYLSKERETVIIQEKPQVLALSQISTISQDEVQNAFAVSSQNVIKGLGKKIKPSEAFFKVILKNEGEEIVENISFYSFHNGKQCENVKKENTKHLKIIANQELEIDFDVKYFVKKEEQGVLKADCVHLLCEYEDSKKQKHQMILGIVIKDEKEKIPVFESFVRVEKSSEFKEALKQYQEVYEKIQKKIV